MKRVLLINACLLVALSLGLGAGAAFAAPPGAPIVPADDGSLTGGGPNPKAVMMYNLGITAYKQGSTDAAVIFFKRACDIDPNLADAQYNLAVIYQAQKRYKEAIPRFEEVLRLKPNDADAQYQLGVIMQDTGNLAGARQHLSAIAPNSSHFPDAQRRLSNLAAAPQSAVQPTYAAPPVAQSPYQQPGQQGANPFLQQPQQPVATGANPFLQPAQPTYVTQPVAAQPEQPAQPIDTYIAPPQHAYAPQQQTYAAPQQQTYAAPQQPVAVAQPLATQNIAVSQGTTTANIAQPLQSPAQVASAAVPGVSVPPNPVPAVPNVTLRVVATGFVAPAGLTFDRNSYLYVANYKTNIIDRIAPDGTRSTFSTGTNLKGPIGLVADDFGNIYVANYDGGTVVKINPAGVSSMVATGFKHPYYLTFDREGNLYVSQQEDNSIVRITLPRPAAASKP